MWYLLGAGASEEEPTIGLLWGAAVVNKVAAVVGAARATTAAAGAAGATTAVVTGVAGGTSAGGGEELHTLGRKACPPRVFTMVGLEDERKWRGEFQTGNENGKVEVYIEVEGGGW